MQAIIVLLVVAVVMALYYSIQDSRRIAELEELLGGKHVSGQYQRQNKDVFTHILALDERVRGLEEKAE